MLRTLATRILELEREGSLLNHAGELMKLIGDIRSELFHYEVRATYDTPEIAEGRRLVNELKSQAENAWERTEWKRTEDDEPTW